MRQSLSTAKSPVRVAHPAKGSRQSPSYSPKVQVTFDPDLLAKVRQRATENHVSFAEMVRRFCRAGIGP